MAQLVNCRGLNSEPYAVVTITNRLTGDVWQLTEYQLTIRPAQHKVGSHNLSLYVDDVPVEALEPWNIITVCIQWPDLGLNWIAYQGFLGSINDHPVVETILRTEAEQDAQNQVWNGPQLQRILKATRIAYPSGSAGAYKSGITAIEAVYQFIVENIETSLADRGDGSVCANNELPCVVVTPPTAVQIANSAAWQGGRSHKELWKTVNEIGRNDGFYVSVVFGDNGTCEHGITVTLVNDPTDTIILSEDLENVRFDQFSIAHTRRVDRVHALGKGQGSERMIATVCADPFPINAWCVNEISFSATQQNDIDALTTLAQEKLTDLNAELVTARVTILDNCNLIMGRDYIEGTPVLLVYDGVCYQSIVENLQIKIHDGEIMDYSSNVTANGEIVANA